MSLNKQLKMRKWNRKDKVEKLSNWYIVTSYGQIIPPQIDEPDGNRLAKEFKTKVRLKKYKYNR